MRRRLFVGLAVFGLFLGLNTEGRAQSLDLSSSMTAMCIGGSCSQITFLLDVQGSMAVDVVRLFSTDQTLWRFGSLMSVLDSGFNDVTSSFSSGITADGLRLSALTPFAVAEPLRLRVQMAQYSDVGELWSNINYTANGEATSDGQGFYSTSGTVTPEPVTSVLLASGLLGIALVARWRRREEDLEV